VELQLQILRLSHHIDAGGAPRPNDADWIAFDLQVKMWLYVTITKELRNMVSSPTATARDVWLSLENIFQGNQMARALNLTDQLHAERQGDLSIVAYCARLKALSDQLRDIGHPLST
jgi:hypothetical protein